MILPDGPCGVLAGLPPLVIRRRGQLMFHARVNKNQFVALRIKREVLVLQCFAVKTDETAFLSENRGELIHDSAFHATVVMLG